MRHKFSLLGNLALKKKDLKKLLKKLMNIEKLSHKDLMRVYECDIQYAE